MSYKYPYVYLLIKYKVYNKKSYNYIFIFQYITSSYSEHTLYRHEYTQHFGICLYETSNIFFNFITEFLYIFNPECVITTLNSFSL